MGDTYNGWTNYETWCIGLWIDNEQGTSEYVAEMASEAVEDWTNRGGREPEGTLADALQEMVEEANPMNDAPASMFTDLMNAALSEVNWYELAANYCQTAREESVDADV